jgi:hypothetical protein
MTVTGHLLHEEQLELIELLYPVEIIIRNHLFFREREICRRYLMTQCVSMFIVNQKEKLDTFVAKFDKLPMADEKV